MLKPDFAYRKSLKISDGEDIASALFFPYSLLVEGIVAFYILVHSLHSDSVTTLRYSTRAVLQSGIHQGADLAFPSLEDLPTSLIPSARALQRSSANT